MEMQIHRLHEGLEANSDTDTGSNHSRRLTDSVASWCSAVEEPEVDGEDSPRDMTAAPTGQASSSSNPNCRQSETEESNSDRQESEGEDHRQGRGKRRNTCQRHLECGVCGLTGLPSEHELTRHIRSHHHLHNQATPPGAEVEPGQSADHSTQAVSTQCKLCGKVLGSVSSLDRHLLVHSGERPFSCRICGTKFTTNGNMHRHMRSHDLTNIGTDGHSDHQPHKKRKVHEFNNNNIGESESPSDSKRRTTVGTAKRGCSTPPAPYSCPACHRREFPTRQLLDSHVDREHPSCRCPDCDAVLRSPKLMANHRVATHGSPRKTPALRAFDEDHLGIIEFSTGKFPMIAEAMAARRPHPSRRFTLLRREEERYFDRGLQNWNDPDDNKKDFLASLDLKKLNLREEELESSGAESTSSGASSSSPPPGCLDMTPPDSGSRSGSAVHDQEEEQDCISADIRRMKLRGEFPCRLCPVVFPNLRALKGHNRVHLAGGHQVEFQCNMCQYSGPDRAAVLRHMRTHNGDRPYECALCNYAFTTKANCERHLRNRHAATRTDLKKSIIYHPSEDPTNDPTAIDTNHSQREDVKRTLFPEEMDDTEEDEHEEKVEGPLDLSMDALDLTKKRRVREEEEDGPQDLSKKKVEPLAEAPPGGLRSFYGGMPTFFPNFLPPYFVTPPHPQLLFRPSPRELAEMKERLQKELLRQLGATSLLMAPPQEEPPIIQEAPPTPPEKPKKVPQQATSTTTTTSSSSSSSVKMVIKNGVLVPKQKQRRYRTERPFGCEHCSAKFTLRSNMERHVKQQHPQFWSRRGPRGSAANRRPQNNKLIINNNNIDTTVGADEVTTKEKISEGVKIAIVEQLKAKIKLEGDEVTRPLDFKSELHRIAPKPPTGVDPDLASVSKLLDNASTQTFRQYFEAANQEEGPTSLVQGTALVNQHQFQTGQNNDVASITSDDEEGLVASHSEESEENKSENESTASNGSCGGGGNGGISTSAKKKSAYSLAPNRVSCPYCFRKFPWSSSLRRHVLTHTGQKPYKCPHCPLLFTTKSNCDRHLTRKHGGGACVEQQPPPPTPTASDQARNVPERPYKCSRCPSSTFSTLSNLKKHVGSKHEDIDDPIPAPATSATPVNSEMPFKCHLCEGAFGERQDALDHLRELHEPEYTALVSKGALESSCEEVDDSEDHSHHQQEPRAGRFPDYANRKVICAFCLRRFWSAEDLRRHMRTHTGERPFSCDVCTRKFTLKHSMLRHRKKHAIGSMSTNQDSKDRKEVDDDGANREEDTDIISADLHQKEDDATGRHTGDSDLIGDLLGIGDKSLVDSILDKSADDAARLLGVVRNK